MRVNSGLLKNRILKSPQNSSVRPTSDKVRAAIFSALGDSVSGCKFLDLFAGSGSVGIEAYSREAAHVTFLDTDTDLLKENVKLLPIGSYSIIKGDIFHCRISGTYDIIFIDPPYGECIPETLLNVIKDKNLLAYNGIIVYEESVRTSVRWDSMPFKQIKSKRYGDTLIVYLEPENLEL